MVRQFLVSDLERGLLTNEEYNQLCTVRGRMGSSFDALSRGGIDGWRARMRFNQMASELAFHRNRASRDVSSANQAALERENAYIQALQDLLQKVRSR